MLPNFEEPSAQRQVRVDSDRPEQLMARDGHEYHFIFIVDRSGSMEDFDRMDIAINSLSIFIQSLP